MNELIVAVILTASATTASASPPSVFTCNAPGLEAPDAYTLTGASSFYDGYPAVTPDGDINVIVEIPAGSDGKWEVDKQDGALRWEFKKGKPRIVNYIGYPGNYGMVPSTLLSEELGGDGDPIDVLILGPSLPRGSVVAARLVGVLKMLDGGELDDKLLAVMPSTSLVAVGDIADLDALFPGVTTIVETWFANYKGPGEIETKGYGPRSEALRMLSLARSAFAEPKAPAPTP